VEYYVEDVSAVSGVNYTDPNSTNSSSWALVGAGDQIIFSTANLSGNSGTLSFKIHVRAVDYPAEEVVVEADIYDRDEVVIQFVDYAYDVYNQLVRRTLDDDGPGGENEPADTFYSYQDGQIALQFDSATATYPSHRYLWNPAAVDQLLADEKVTSAVAGAVLWPLADHMGTIRDLASYNSTTNTTTIENHRVYDSFGNLVSETNAAVDELFGYTGRLFDEATGLQNNLNRWYDAKTGRWMSEDPIGFLAGDTNLYRYVLNRPLTLVDPSGNEPITIAVTVGVASLRIYTGTLAVYYSWCCGDCLTKAGELRARAVAQLQGDPERLIAWLKNAKPGAECMDICIKAGVASLSFLVTIGNIVVKYSITPILK
jgi:RHS repeat-associated protein